MPQIVNTNIESLNAQRNLNRSQAALSTALQRLSSGLRVNSAKDDAAGLGIADRFTTQIRGLSQAIRNANDAISLSQTAEGALSEHSNALQRIRELAVQSANATNSSNDRNSLNAEVQQLIAEMDRIATQTDFNGNKILSTTGGFTATFQVGAGVGHTVSTTVDAVRTTDLGVSSNFGTIQTETATAATFALRLRNQYATATTSATVNGATIADVAAYTNSVSKIDALNAVTGTSGVTAFSYGNSLSSGATAADDDGTSLALNAGDVVINGVSVGAVAVNSANALVTAINAITGQTGVTADAAAGGTSALVLYNTTGAAITLQINSANAATRSGFAQGTTSVGAGQNGAIVLNASLSGNTVTYSDATDGQALTGTSAASTALTQTRLSAVTVTSVANSNLAILAVDESLKTVSAVRGRLGAVQNRIETTIANLSTNVENSTAARSRIMDADFASETAALTRGQILQQAGVAVLAQANALPQRVLALLQ